VDWKNLRKKTKPTRNRRDVLGVLAVHETLTHPKLCLDLRSFSSKLTRNELNVAMRRKSEEASSVFMEEQCAARLKTFSGGKRYA